MNSNWNYSPDTPNLGQIRRFLLAVWPWDLTDELENNRAPLLSNIKLCASFHGHLWIQTEVTVRKRLNWVMTFVTLTFDSWPGCYTWTPRLSMVINSWKFQDDTMTGTLSKRCDGRTDRRRDGRADGRTDGNKWCYSCLVAAKNISYCKIVTYHVSQSYVLRCGNVASYLLQYTVWYCMVLYRI